MNYRSVYFAMVILFFCSQKITAQQHYNTWFKTTIGFPIHTKLKADVEFHHRRQNDIDKNNPLDKNLLSAIRTMVFYKHNEHWQFALSPFAYFSNHKIIINPADAFATARSEFRFSTYAEWQKKLKAKWALVYRTGIEYRIFEVPNNNVTRIRNRLALKFEAIKNLNFSLADEIFINASGTTAIHIFDHNRIIALASYKIYNNIKLEFGYIHIARKPKSSTVSITEKNILFNIACTIPNK